MLAATTETFAFPNRSDDDYDEVVSDKTDEKKLNLVDIPTKTSTIENPKLKLPLHTTLYSNEQQYVKLVLDKFHAITALIRETSKTSDITFYLSTQEIQKGRALFMTLNQKIKSCAKSAGDVSNDNDNNENTKNSNNSNGEPKAKSSRPLDCIERVEIIQSLI